MEIEVGDIFLKPTNRKGREVEINNKIYCNVKLCVITHINTLTGNFTCVLDGGNTQYLSFGGVHFNRKIGRFKKDYDFDEKFNLIKLKNDK